MRTFNIPDATVTITKIRAGEAVVSVGGDSFAVRYDQARRGWVLSDGRFSASPKLHSIGKLFGIRRAAVAGAPEIARPAPVATADPLILRQIRRILASMDEFGFDPGGLWRTQDHRTGEIVEGWTPRAGGDPIFHTIGQVSGVVMDRADAREAIAAVLAGRHPNLPPRMAPVPAAVLAIAEALAYNRGGVTLDCGLVQPIDGPWLPDNWEPYTDEDEPVPAWVTEEVV